MFLKKLFKKHNYREHIWERTDYNLFLQFPIKRWLSKGIFIKDTSSKFPRFINKLKERSCSKAVILGNAECLNELDAAAFNALETNDFLTIGLNRSIYKFQTDILIWSDLLTIKDILQKKTIKRENCYVLHALLERNHKLPAAEDPCFQYLNKYWEKNRNFKNWPKTKLYMFRNVLTAALFLCYKLDIREILLVGFGFDDRQYFYKTKKYKNARGYEIHSNEMIAKNCGGYDTLKLVKEILEYLINEEQFHISYNGNSEFLSGIEGLNRIDLKEICWSLTGV
jgi:hypothetical protein